MKRDDQKKRVELLFIIGALLLLINTIATIGLDFRTSDQKEFIEENTEWKCTEYENETEYVARQYFDEEMAIEFCEEMRCYNEEQIQEYSGHQVSEDFMDRNYYNLYQECIKKCLKELEPTIKKLEKPIVTEKITSTCIERELVWKGNTQKGGEYGEKVTYKPSLKEAWENQTDYGEYEKQFRNNGTGNVTEPYWELREEK